MALDSSNGHSENNPDLESLEDKKLRLEISLLEKQNSRRFYGNPSIVAAISTTAIAVLAFLTALQPRLFSEEVKELQSEINVLTSIRDKYNNSIRQIDIAYQNLDQISDDIFKLRELENDLNGISVEIDISTNTITFDGISYNADQDGTYSNTDFAQILLCIKCISNLSSLNSHFKAEQIEAILSNEFEVFQSIKEPKFSDYEDLIQKLTLHLEQFEDSLLNNRLSIQKAIRGSIKDVKQ